MIPPRELKPRKKNWPIRSKTVWGYYRNHCFGRKIFSKFMRLSHERRNNLEYLVILHYGRIT
jgi:hypothetical protein